MKNMRKNSSEFVSVNDVTRISNGAEITGDLISQGDIRVDGVITGRIFSGGRVVVGEGANISGTLMCADMDLWGKIEGDVYVKDTICIKGTANMKGNLNVRRIEVEVGAEINGNCRMISEEVFETKRASVFENSVTSEPKPKPVKKPAVLPKITAKDDVAAAPLS